MGTEYAWAQSDPLETNESSRFWNTYSASSFCDISSAMDCSVYEAVNDREENSEITFNGTWEVYTYQNLTQYWLGLHRPLGKWFTTS